MQKIFLLFLLVISNSIFAEKLLESFICITEQDAIACNNNCDGGRYLAEFQVNVSKNLVMKTNYEVKNLTTPMGQPFYIDECKVTDKNNWRCTHYLKEHYNLIGTITTVNYKGVISEVLTLNENNNKKPTKIFACFK